MNIDKIIADELRSNYSNKVKKAPKILGLTFSDLKNYIRVGKSNHGRRDAAFKSYFGEYAKLPRHAENCICGHEITEQCYLCPEGSKSIDDILTVCNRCIHKWGYDPAIRGKGEKINVNFV